MNKAIWVLTDEENNEILELYEKKIALENLAKILDSDNELLRNRLVVDYGHVLHKFQDWWNYYSGKYHWETGGNWAINFSTKEVLLHDIV
jgi:CXXX repeat modification system protein